MKSSVEMKANERSRVDAETQRKNIFRHAGFGFLSFAQLCQSFSQCSSRQITFAPDNSESVAGHYQ